MLAYLCLLCADKYLQSQWSHSDLRILRQICCKILTSLTSPVEKSRSRMVQRRRSDGWISWSWSAVSTNSAPRRGKARAHPRYLDYKRHRPNQPRAITTVPLWFFRPPYLFKSSNKGKWTWIMTWWDDRDSSLHFGSDCDTCSDI